MLLNEAWLAVSEASRRLELKQDVAHAAKQAVILAPRNTEAHRHWIEALLALERIEEAAEAAAVLIGLDADDPTAGFESYDEVSDADRRALTGPVTVLAEDLSTLRGLLGLN